MPYVTPDDVPEATTCRSLLIPTSTDWLAIISGALTELTKSYNWEQTSTGITVEEAVAVCKAMIDAYYTNDCENTCALPGGSPVFRLDVDGHIQQLVNGEWVEPTGEYTIPPVPPRTEPTAEERRCLAAANAADVMKRLYEEISDAFNEDKTLEEVLLIILEFIALRFFWLAPIAAGLLLLAIAAMGIVYALVEFFGADLWTEEFNDVFKCILYECSLDDGSVVTFDYACVQGKLESTLDVIDENVEGLRLLTQLGYILNSIGGVDALNAMGATTEVETASCDDCGPVCPCWLGGCGLGTLEPVEGSEYDEENDIVTGAYFGSANYASAIVPVLEGVEYTISTNGTWAGQTTSGTAQFYWIVGVDFGTLIEVNTFPGMGDGVNSPFWHATPVPAGYDGLYITFASIGASSTVTLDGVQLCVV